MGPSRDVSISSIPSRSGEGLGAIHFETYAHGRYCFLIQSPVSGRVLVTGAPNGAEFKPGAAFGGVSFPDVTQADNASARYAAIIKVFTVFLLVPVCSKHQHVSLKRENRTSYW